MGREEMKSFLIILFLTAMRGGEGDLIFSTETKWVAGLHLFA